MTTRDDLVEAVTRKIHADQMGGKFEDAEPDYIDMYRDIARAAIAIVVERCARVAEGHEVEILRLHFGLSPQQNCELIAELTGSQIADKLRTLADPRK